MKATGSKEYCAEIYAEVVPEKVRRPASPSSPAERHAMSVAADSACPVLKGEGLRGGKQVLLSTPLWSIGIRRADGLQVSAKFLFGWISVIWIGQMARLFEMAFLPSFLGLLPRRA